METKQKFWILPLFFVVLIDMLGIGIIVPIIAPLMLNPSNGILPADYSFWARNFLLGLLVSVFPIFQFFGAPILGALSDRHGRKKLLIVSIFGAMVGYIIFAWGIMAKNLVFLFLGRIIAGFMGGNIAIAFSSIADVSGAREKAKNFGLIGMAFGFGFVIGPYIGGKLADSSFVSWFDFSTPLWFAALLSFMNIIIVQLVFSDTLHTKVYTKISLLTGFQNIANAFKMQNLRTIFFVIFLHSLGFSFFAQFFQVLLIEKFSFSQVQIGNLFAYIGLWIAFTQGIITRIAAKHFAPNKVLRFSLAGLSIALFIVILPAQSKLFYLIMPLVALTQGLTFPNSTAIVSNLSGKESQGEALGINQSLQSLAFAISPLIAGIIVSFNIHFPIIAASSIVFIAWLVFLLFFKEAKRETFHEI